MRVLIYEFVTGGGFFCLPEAPVPGGSLLREGAAMVQAIVGDFAQMIPPPSQITVLRDVRLRRPVELPECRCLDIASISDLQVGLTTPCDVALVIAPETDGLLQRACRHVRATAGLLLNAPDELIALASSKNQAAVWLTQHNVPCPAGARLCDGKQTPANNLTFPLVVKPDDGCGSVDVMLARSQDELRRRVSSGATWRVEEYMPGRPASVAALCGAGTVHWLAPCWQLFEPNSFVFSGCQLMTDEPSRERALHLVRGLDALLSDAVGYIGVDIVLGDPVDGSADVVIEINPRLTTSYAELSRACRTNLMEAMLRIVSGRTVQLDFDPPRVGDDGALAADPVTS